MCSKIEKIRADAYYEPFEYLCFKYTFKELMLYAKDFALKIDDKIIKVQSRIMLAKVIKKSLDTEEIRQSLAWNLRTKYIKKSLKTSKSFNEFKSLIKEIDDDLLKDAYSLCGEKYEREKMINLILHDSSEMLYCYAYNGSLRAIKLRGEAENQQIETYKAILIQLKEFLNR